MSARVIRAIAELRAALAEARAAGLSIGLVPTMGALHAGHGALIAQARRETGCLVVTIFVNPTQFNRQDDYKLYPRTFERDLAFASELGADLVFAPSLEEMYPHPQTVWVEVGEVAEHLCGRFRPGHFRGVATVVLKLLEIAQPGRAYFGEKDAQQLAVIRRMVRDLNIPVIICGVPIVREPDGLALSSRNQRLDPHGREIAPALYQSLEAARRAVEEGARDPEEIRRRGMAVLARHPEIRSEYLEIVDPESMQPVARVEGPVLIAAAVWIGDVRLIDNVRAG